MIKAVKSLVPWEQSIPSKRQTCSLSCLTASGVLRQASSREWFADIVQKLWKRVDDNDLPEDIRRLGLRSVEDLVRYLRMNTKKNLELYATVWNKTIIGHFDSVKLSLFYQFGGENLYNDGCALTDDHGNIKPKDIHAFVKQLKIEDFWLAELYDDQYVYLQSLGYFDNYKYTKGLVRQAGNEKWVVLDNRPGRGVALPDKTFSIYGGAAHFWFGGMTFEEYIPKERFLSFTEAEEIIEFPNGIIYINLYKDMFKGHEPEAQRRQLAFREHLGLV